MNVSQSSIVTSTRDSFILRKCKTLAMSGVLSVIYFFIFRAVFSNFKRKEKKMFVRGAWFLISAFFLMIFIVVNCGLITPREMEIRRANQMSPKKRPFCNAFTGCGRKRSESSKPQNMPEEEPEGDNTLSDLIDLNSEPAVEDLMRQIMSQAKLWEAIQEASREISSHKSDNLDAHNRYPISFNAQ